MNKVPAIKSHVFGLKCDAPGCGYRDESVQVSEYEASIGRPCPLCGANLLTRGDYEITMAIMAIVASVNEAVGPVDAAPADTPRVAIAVELNGTGEVAFRLKRETSAPSRTNPEGEE